MCTIEITARRLVSECLWGCVSTCVYDLCAVWFVCVICVVCVWFVRLLAVSVTERGLLSTGVGMHVLMAHFARLGRGGRRDGEATAKERHQVGRLVGWFHAACSVNAHARTLARTVVRRHDCSWHA